MTTKKTLVELISSGNSILNGSGIQYTLIPIGPPLIIRMKPKSFFGMDSAAEEMIVAAAPEGANAYMKGIQNVSVNSRIRSDYKAVQYYRI